jgi:hypothetical protein
LIKAVEKAASQKFEVKTEGIDERKNQEEEQADWRSKNDILWRKN